eukprot:c19882_g1_i1 orf=95-1138(+)
MKASDYMWSLAKLSVLGAAAYGLLYRFPISCLLCSEALEDPLHADRLAKILMLKELRENPGINFAGALRIPDTGDEDHKEVDLVILTRRKLYLVEAKSWSEKVKREIDGSWCQKYADGSLLRHGNIAEEVKKRAALLESYLFRRGLKPPSSFVQYIIVFTNPDCRVDETILCIPGVFSLQQWKAFLRKKAQKSALSWMIPKKGKMMSSGFYQQLVSILSTAPTWDRLTLEGGDIVLGNFLHFNGSVEDMEALKMVKRSRVSDVSITSKQEHTYILGLYLKTASMAEVRCTLRDYREASSRKDNKDKADESVWLARVRGDTEVVFQVVGSMSSQMFKMSNVLFIHLSA